MRITLRQLRSLVREAVESDGLSAYGKRMIVSQVDEFLETNPPPYDADAIARHVARFLPPEMPYDGVIKTAKLHLATYRGIPGRGATREGGLR